MLAALLLFTGFASNFETSAEAISSNGTTVLDSITQLANANLSEIKGGYTSADKYVVMTGRIKAMTQVAYDFSQSIGIGVSGTVPWGNYSFQFVFGANNQSNAIQLCADKGYGNHDGIWISQFQDYNDPAFENLFADGGVDIKLIRLNTWAYLLGDFGKGYELIGKMYVPEEEPTQLSLYNGNTPIRLSKITVTTGKAAAVSALEGSIRLDGGGTYFPVDSTAWTVEGKLTADSSTFNMADENRILYVGENTWQKTVAVNYNAVEDVWLGQELESWAGSGFDKTLGALAVSDGDGLYARWIREGEVLSFWLSKDGNNWKHVQSHNKLSDGESGIYLMSQADYHSKLSDVKVSLTSVYPKDFEVVSTYDATPILYTPNLATEKYAVMDAHLQSSTVLKHDNSWSQYFLVGVSGTQVWQDDFMGVYFPNATSSYVKLNDGKAGSVGVSGNQDTIEQLQSFDVKLEKICTSEGLNIRMIRMDTIAYLMAEFDGKWEIVGRMPVNTNALTQFRIYTVGMDIQVTDASIQTGQEAVAVALDNTQISLQENINRFFDFDNEEWVVEANINNENATTMRVDDIVNQGNNAWNAINSVNNTHVVLNAKLRINGTVDRNSYPSLYLYAGSGEQKFKLQFNPDGMSTVLVADGGITQDGVTIPVWQKPCVGSPLEQVFTNEGLEIKLVRMNTWAYLFAKTADGYELIAKRAVVNGDATSFAILSESIGSATYDVKDITVSTGMEATIDAVEGTTIDLNDGAVHFPIDSADWTLRGKVTISDTGVLTGSFINNILLASPDYSDKAICLTSVFDSTLHGYWLRNGSAEQIKNDLTKLAPSSGGEWVTWIRNGAAFYFQSSENGTDWRGIYSHGELGSAKGGVHLWSEKQGVKFTIKEFEKRDIVSNTTNTELLGVVVDDTGSKLSISSNDVNSQNVWVRFVRVGRDITLYSSEDGSNYQELKKTEADGASGSITLQGTTMPKNFRIRVGEHSIEEIGSDAIVIATQPVKTEYYENDTFDPSGMVVELKEGTKTVRRISLEELKISLQELTSNDTEVVVSYNEFSTTVPVQVVAIEAISARVKDLPYQSQYKKGEIFNASGTTYLVTYNNGDMKEYDITTDMCDSILP